MLDVYRRLKRAIPAAAAHARAAAARPLRRGGRHWSARPACRSSAAAACRRPSCGDDAVILVDTIGELVGRLGPGRRGVRRRHRSTASAAGRTCSSRRPTGRPSCSARTSGTSATRRPARAKWTAPCKSTTLHGLEAAVADLCGSPAQRRSLVRPLGSSCVSQQGATERTLQALEFLVVATCARRRRESLTFRPRLITRGLEIESPSSLRRLLQHEIERAILLGRLEFLRPIAAGRVIANLQRGAVERNDALALCLRRLGRP